MGTAVGKSFEDDDVELICSKSGLGPLQALTDALAATDSPQEHQSLLQVCSSSPNPIGNILHNIC